MSLDSRGEFYLNHGAMLKLGDPPAVKLLYDNERKLIGIAPAFAHTKDTFRLRLHEGEERAGRKFAASRFCHAIGMIPDRTIRFLEPRIEEGIVILDTAATEPAQRRGQLKSRQETTESTSQSIPQFQGV